MKKQWGQLVALEQAAAGKELELGCVVAVLAVEVTLDVEGKVVVDEIDVTVEVELDWISVVDPKLDVESMAVTDDGMLFGSDA